MLVSVTSSRSLELKSAVRIGDRTADEREVTADCRGMERLTAIFRVADADLQTHHQTDRQRDTMSLGSCVYLCPFDWHQGR